MQTPILDMLLFPGAASKLRPEIHFKAAWAWVSIRHDVQAQATAVTPEKGNFSNACMIYP